MTAAGLLVFLFCFTSFGVILILGGPRFATLEVEIYRQAVTLFALPQAAALSLAQIVITFVVMVIYTRAASARRAAVEPPAGRIRCRAARDRGPGRRPWRWSSSAC